MMKTTVNVIGRFFIVTQWIGEHRAKETPFHVSSTGRLRLRNYINMSADREITIPWKKILREGWEFQTNKKGVYYGNGYAA